MLRRTSLIACIIVAASAAARADLVSSTSGLIGPEFTITFGDAASEQDSVVYDDGTKITNQYSDFGVTFGGTTNGGVYYGQAGDYGFGRCLRNFNANAPTAIEISFGSNVTTAVALVNCSRWLTSAHDELSYITLDAYLGDTLVDSQQGHSNFGSGAYSGDQRMYLGISNVTLNKLVLTATNEYGATFQIDNLQAIHAMPEPMTGVMLSAAILGLLAYAWRNRKQ